MCGTLYCGKSFHFSRGEPVSVENPARSCEQMVQDALSDLVSRALSCSKLKYHEWSPLVWQIQYHEWSPLVWQVPLDFIAL